MAAVRHRQPDAGGDWPLSRDDDYPEDGAARQSKVQSPKSKVGRPALALITLVPLVWLLAVTVTAGVQKIWNADPRIGFLAQAKVLSGKMPSLERALAAAKTAGDAGAIEQAEKALHTNGVLRFNNLPRCGRGRRVSAPGHRDCAAQRARVGPVAGAAQAGGAARDGAGLAAGLCGGRIPAAPRGRGGGGGVCARQRVVGRGRDGPGAPGRNPVRMRA